MSDNEFQNLDFKNVEGVESINKQTIQRFKKLTQLANEKKEFLEDKVHKASKTHSKQGSRKNILANQENDKKDDGGNLTMKEKVELDTYGSQKHQMAHNIRAYMCDKHHSSEDEFDVKDFKDRKEPSHAHGHSHEVVGGISAELIKAVKMKMARGVKGNCELCQRPFKQAPSSEGSDVDINEFIKGKKNLDDNISKIVKIAEERKSIVEQQNLYPEIKIPLDFIAKFEKKKNLSIGTLNYSKREFQDECRIRYLQFTMKRIEDYHEKEMQEMEIRMRNKIHGYARACLETLGFELKT